MQTVENAVTGYAQQILNQVRRVVVGKDNVLLWVLAAILAKGHILLEDIPGLHQKAGSKRVYELHGSVLRNYCVRCGKFHSAEFVKNSTGVPKCDCGGIVKPDVVLYEEGLDQATIEKSVMAIHRADLPIVAGTSLTVYPAAGLINYYQGNRLVLINRDETPYDRHADLVFHDSLGDIFSQL